MEGIRQDLIMSDEDAEYEEDVEINVGAENEHAYAASKQLLNGVMQVQFDEGGDEEDANPEEESDSGGAFESDAEPDLEEAADEDNDDDDDSEYDEDLVEEDEDTEGVGAVKIQPKGSDDDAEDEELSESELDSDLEDFEGIGDVDLRDSSAQPALQTDAPKSPNGCV